MSDHRSGTGGETGTGSALASWLLLEGNRLVVAAGVVVFTALLLLAVLWGYGLDSLAPNSPMYFLFGSLLTGNLTLLTVVLSINQLVLSRELGAPGTLRERIDRTVDFRSTVEDTTDVRVSPNSPANFLELLHESVKTRAHALEEQTAGVGDGELRRRIRSLADSLVEGTETVNRVDEARTVLRNHDAAAVAGRVTYHEHPDGTTPRRTTRR